MKGADMDTTAPGGVLDRAPMRARVVSVQAGGLPQAYDVLVGRGLLRDLPSLLMERVPAHGWVVIADTTVAAFYGGELVQRLRARGLDANLLTFPAGEQHKTRETWANLTDAMLALGSGRDAAVVALGGGVTGDLAGFVAASFMRGVPVVQVPTSLVAMIDASVGGKTGVDTPAGKNLVGAFHPPRLVVADPETVRTLPVAERAQGLVEAFKHGFILDEAYLDTLERDVSSLLAGDEAALEAAVLRSVELKAMVVTRDEREGHYRQILNFGHTLGHALEAASGYRLPHGSAVGLGMVLEARLGEMLGVTASDTWRRVARAVESLGLPSRLPEGFQAEAALSFLGTDKKRREGRVRCVLLRRAGVVDQGVEWSHVVERGCIEAIMAEAGDQS